MVRGGRGYVRGSGGGRGSYRGSSSNYHRSGSTRNNSSSGGGGGSNYNNSRSYSSSSRYPYDSGSRSGDRFSSSRHSDRHDDHKRSSSYRTSSRDRSPDRKRSRHEDSRLSSNYSSSSYRGADSSRSRRTPPSSTTASRGSSSTYRHREGSSHRHSLNEPMGPPKSLPPRSSGRLIRPSRGGGTVSRIRGSTSRGIRIVRHRESTDMRIMRRKLLIARQKDRIRRIKIAKLTSSLRRRRDTVEPRKTDRKSSRSEKRDDDPKKSDSEKEKKKSKGDDENDKEKEDTDEKGEESETEKKEIKKQHRDDVEEENKVENWDNIEMEKEKEGGKSPKSRTERSYIKLNCCHCRSKYTTFKEYIYHLRSRTHKLAMRRLAMLQKSKLSQMRAVQRKVQRELEESSKDEINDSQPEFCLLCRLNYRTPKAKHQLSEAHRNMKKFLMPYCSTCRIAFKSPMVYESHRCSLDHLKKKAAKNVESHSDVSEDEKEVDLTNFLTVDSVGEIDGINETDEKIEEGKEKVNVGAEHVKKTEAYYCDLCSVFFPINDEENAVKKHCITRSHLKSFLRYGQDQNLRLKAERIQRRQKETKEKKKGKDSDEKCDDEKGNEEMGEEEAEENDDIGDAKSWEEVDKDIGDFFCEDGNVDDDCQDEEEDCSILDINLERYSRFKKIEKMKKNELNGEGIHENENIKKDPEENTTPPSTPIIKVKKESDMKIGSAKIDEKTVEAK